MRELFKGLDINWYLTGELEKVIKKNMSSSLDYGANWFEEFFNKLGVNALHAYDTGTWTLVGNIIITKSFLVNTTGDLTKKELFSKIYYHPIVDNPIVPKEPPTYIKDVTFNWQGDDTISIRVVITLYQYKKKRKKRKRRKKND